MNQSSAPNPQANSTSASPVPPLKPKSNDIPETNTLLEQIENAQSQPQSLDRPEPLTADSSELKQPQPSRWSFSTKVMLGAIASTTIPLFLLGIGGYWTGQSLKKNVTEAPAVEAIQTYSTNLLLGTGALVVLSGAIATLVASRATREI